MADLHQEILHTQALLSAYPFLSTLVPPFVALLPSWLALHEEELGHDRAIALAEARIVAVDDAFDYLAVAISSALLAELGGNRKAERYLRYYGAAPPGKLKRPVLGEQLATMRDWVPSLTAEETSPTLQAYGQQLAERVMQADQAVTALAQATQQRTDFVMMGARKAFVDTLNALRLTTYGQVAELPHKRPDLNLPRDFGDRFFLRDTSHRKPSVSDVEQVVLRLRARLQKQEDLLERLQEEAEEEARLQEEAEVRAAEEVLLAAERKRADAQKKLDAAKAKASERQK
ncbi:Hypothetical protein CAP_4117 [Chondromyces apiculatus DSM 436]|uniref:Uncharacterized protein n=2 Tax=Chondromyces apiculatus TaxID=51 RepID=A0A017TI90_9BACT|nr:Hypothetical protein CAP_4117 [Chondromyces apiculatus DSM 436]